MGSREMMTRPRRERSLSIALERPALDLSFALRSLTKRPGFTIAALLTLALGIGATVAMFSVANLALFRALPYPDADRLVLGRTSWPGGGIGWTVSAPDYYDVRQQASSFHALAAITPFTREVTITGDGDPRRAAVAWISPGFLRALGVAPLIGREFLTQEGRPGADPVVILSHDLSGRAASAPTPNSSARTSRSMGRHEPSWG